MASRQTFLCTLVQGFLLVSIVAMIGSIAAVAQIDRAVLEGTVLDPSGAAIVGASVKILAQETGISQEQPTNSQGYYRFPGIAVGRYTMTVDEFRI